MGTGKIQVDELLKPGLIYALPPFTVFNSGDEPSEYGVGIQFHEDQPEMRPLKEWFSFEPSQFHLEPGQSQVVQIKLTLPVKGVNPGDYFAFLQGFPVKKTTAGGTSIGVAAAAKLYFTVAPANFFTGAYYRIVSFFALYSPWSWVVLGAVLAVVIVTLFKKHFAFQIGISRKQG